MGQLVKITLDIFWSEEKESRTGKINICEACNELIFSSNYRACFLINNNSFSETGLLICESCYEILKED